MCECVSYKYVSTISFHKLEIVSLHTMGGYPLYSGQTVSSQHQEYQFGCCLRQNNLSNSLAYRHVQNKCPL